MKQFAMCAPFFLSYPVGQLQRDKLPDVAQTESTCLKVSCNEDVLQLTHRDPLHWYAKLLCRCHEVCSMESFSVYRYISKKLF